MLWNGGITAGIYDRRNGVGPLFCAAAILRTECPLWVKSGHGTVSGPMSAIHPKADIADAMRDVRFVPKAGIPRCSKKRRY
jgi:hypothetical protein